MTHNQLIVIKNVRSQPFVSYITDPAKDLIKIVGGFLNPVRVGDTNVFAVSDESAFNRMKPINLQMGNHLICGDVAFVRRNEDGSFQDLTDADMEMLSVMMNHRIVYNSREVPNQEVAATTHETWKGTKYDSLEDASRVLTNTFQLMEKKMSNLQLEIEQFQGNVEEGNFTNEETKEQSISQLQSFKKYTSQLTLAVDRLNNQLQALTEDIE